MMDALVPNRKTDIFHNLNFNAFFPELTGLIKTGVEKFWELDTLISLQAINDFREIREEKLVRDVDFFTSQIRVENHKPAVIRLSKNFVEGFLDTTLNSNEEEFKLSSITSLEIKILNNFTEFLYKRIKEILLSPHDIKLSEKSEKNINFFFLITPKTKPAGYIVLSLAQDRLPFKKIEHKIAFKDEDFLTSSAYVKIRIGRTKVTLDDLEHLSVDDIIVLEDSNISYLTLLSGRLEKNFKVKVDSSLIINLENEDDEDGQDNQINTHEFYNNEVTMEKNLWDDIQIELSAEFEKVKMTIGELKQITQGQVVDLGSVFNNEISLYVENKKVAKGELVIINERYAVKLNEVLNSSINQQKAQKQTPPPQTQQQTPKTEAKAPPEPPRQASKVEVKVEDDEEFDYSDFEQ